MEAAYFRLLFAYNRWANRRVLAAAAKVEAGEYVAMAAGLSFYGLHGTLVHILVAEIVWLARWNHGEPPSNLADARKSDAIAAEHMPDFATLTRMWEEHNDRLDAYLRLLKDEDVDRPLSYRTQYGEPNTQPLSQLLAHVVNHGTQFRAEAAVRLTQLGVSPGDLDLIVYLRSGGEGSRT